MKLKIILTAAALLAIPAPSAFAQQPFFDSGANSANASSWVVGAQAGYNWQRGPIVFGVETDISATHLKTDMNTLLLGNFTPSPTANTNSNVDWFGTIRGRLGWTTGPLLFYGTGGLAYGGVELNSTLSSFGLTLNSQTSSVKTGWVAGAGIDYMWRPNLILNLGYQYVDLGTVSLASSVTLPPQSLNQGASANARFHVVTVGLNWLFSPADTAPRGAWEGLYVGGHVGGAWGNNTDAVYTATPPASSDIRLKRDITLVGRLDDGLGLYRYRYLWSDTVYIGVMAQEVAFVHPEAVIPGPDGYLRVDYSRLGLKLMTEPEWNAQRAAAVN